MTAAVVAAACLCEWAASCKLGRHDPASQHRQAWLLIKLLLLLLLLLLLTLG
jgi:hypothetical protein